MVHVVKITDGLGNQMFQYAFARRLQMMKGVEVYLDTRFINNEDRIARGETNFFLQNNDHREYKLNHFRINIPVADETILSRWREDRRNSVWHYRNEEEFWTKVYLERLRWKFPTYFQGYFFDLKYYRDIRAVLQRDFRLKQPTRLPRRLIEVLRFRNTVSMHIRRGDFMKLNCSICDDRYYLKAMRGIKNRKIEDPIYLVFSDDIKWVKKNIEIDAEKIYVSEMGFPDYVEFSIMKHCRHHIIANSTFSYWAAYLNHYSEKIVIYPENWAKTEIIPTDWIGITACTRSRV